MPELSTICPTCKKDGLLMHPDLIVLGHEFNDYLIVKSYRIYCPECDFTWWVKGRVMEEVAANWDALCQSVGKEEPINIVVPDSRGRVEKSKLYSKILFGLFCVVDLAAILLRVLK